MTAHKMYNHFKRLHYKSATMHGEILRKACWKPVKNVVHKEAVVLPKLTFLSNKLKQTAKQFAEKQNGQFHNFSN